MFNALMPISSALNLLMVHVYHLEAKDPLQNSHMLVRGVVRVSSLRIMNNIVKHLFSIFDDA